MNRDNDYNGDNPIVYVWDSQVKRSMMGKRGHRGLIYLLEALEAMPEKVLYSQMFVDDGAVCALGALAVYDRMKIDDLIWLHAVEVVEFDAQDRENPLSMYDPAEKHGISRTLAAEIIQINDWYDEGEEPVDRWKRIHSWVVDAIALGDKGETGTPR